MTKLKYTLIALISMLCALTLTSCMDLYDKDEIDLNFDVTLDGNGGSYTDSEGITYTTKVFKDVKYGDKVTLLRFSKAGSEHIGWAYDKDSESGKYSITASEPFYEKTTLYAVWKEKSGFHVTYSDSVEGKKIDVPADDNDYLFGASVTVLFTPIGKYEAHTFIGWKDGDGNLYTETGTKTFNMPEHDVTLLAQWEPNSIQPGGITTEVGDVTKKEANLYTGTPIVSKSQVNSVVFRVEKTFVEYKWFINGAETDKISGSDGNYSWDISSFPCENYCIMVEVTDSEGNLFSDTIYVSIKE